MQNLFAGTAGMADEEVWHIWYEQMIHAKAPKASRADQNGHENK